MFDMIHAEIYKLKYNKTLPVLFLVILFLVILSVTVTYLTQKVERIEATIINGQLAAYQSPVSSTYLFIFVSILAAEIVVSEYSRGIIKNLIASGKYKWQIYLSKLIALAITSFAFSIFCVVSYAITYTIVFGWGSIFQYSDMLPILRFIGLTAVILLAIDSVVMIISIYFRNPVPTIGVCGGIAFLEIIFAKLFTAIPILKSLIIYFPLVLTKSIAQSEPLSKDIANIFIVSLLILTFSSFIGYQIFKFQDVK